MRTYIFPDWWNISRHSYNFDPQMCTLTPMLPFILLFSLVFDLIYALTLYFASKKKRHATFNVIFMYCVCVFLALPIDFFFAFFFYKVYSKWMKIARKKKELSIQLSHFHARKEKCHYFLFMWKPPVNGTRLHIAGLLFNLFTFDSVSYRISWLHLASCRPIKQNDDEIENVRRKTKAKNHGKLFN